MDGNMARPEALEPPGPLERTGLLTSDDFARVLGTTFSVAPDASGAGAAGRGLTATSVEVEAGSGGRCFSVFFSAPGPDVLPQRIYLLRHTELGELALFLVPIGIEPHPAAATGAGEGVVRYEALFNRLPDDRLPGATP